MMDHASVGGEGGCEHPQCIRCEKAPRTGLLRWNGTALTILLALAADPLGI